MRPALFFDVETNGLQGTSVLSFSAYVVDIDPDTLQSKIIEKINRFYFPIEPWDMEAAKIHGLTKEVVTQKRYGVPYPIHFVNDPYILDLVKSRGFFVAHNIRYDESFLPIPLPESRKFDTMDYCESLTALPTTSEYKTYKSPKLLECIAHFNIPVDKSQLHESIYDVEMMYQVFLKLAADPRCQDDIKNWLNRSKHLSRLYLNVAFDDKDKVKKLGAKWDPDHHKWYVPYIKDHTRFTKWK